MRNLLKFSFLVGCVVFISHSVSAKSNPVDRFAEVVDSLHSSMVFPYNVAPGIVLTNVGVDKNERMLIINYTLNPEFVEAVIKNTSSENGIAQLLTGYDEIFSTSMIEAEAGYRIIVTCPSADGLNKTQIATVPASAIPIVYSKLKSGDNSSLKPYLEMLESTFSNMQFPLKVAERLYLINGFIKDKEANWVYRIEDNDESANIADGIIQYNRIAIQNNLRANMSADYLNEIEKQGITLHYTYLNDAGDILYEYIFTAEDLK
ncbi:MAG: hypothetical protein K2I26_01695 [Paramuribaculum sp.]|nr:hypothetical protein [Paramuribaculum sp.]